MASSCLAVFDALILSYIHSINLVTKMGNWIAVCFKLSVFYAHILSLT